MSMPATVSYPYSMTHGQLFINSLANTTYTMSYSSAFNTTPQGLVAISGMEITPNLLIDFQLNFQHLTSTSFKIDYTSYSLTFSISKITVNYLIFIAQGYRGTYSFMSPSYTAFYYSSINENPSGSSVFANGTSLRSFSRSKTNHYVKYQGACFLFFRGMKISTTTTSTLYQMNMTCYDSQLYASIRLYVGANTTILMFKASLLVFDKYELEINKNMNINFGYVEYSNGITNSIINLPSSDYAVIFGLSRFTFSTTSNLFNIANDLSSNSSFSSLSGYNALTYIFFTLLSCPNGTVLNRLTQMCDAPACSKQSQLFSPQIVSGVSLYEIRNFKQSTLFLIYSNRLDIYNYQAGSGFIFSYRLEFLSFLSSLFSYDFTTDYSRMVVADKNQNIAVYVWNGNSYAFQNMIFVQKQNSKSIMCIRISDDALTLFIDYTSTSSIYTFNTYIYNGATNRYEYSTTYNRNVWSSNNYQSFLIISKQNKTNIYMVVGNDYQYMKQMYVSNLYQTVTKSRLDGSSLFKSRSYSSYDKSLIVTIFMDATRYGIAIYQKDPVTLIHKEIQFIPNLYALFKYVAIDKQGLTIFVCLNVNMHFLVYKRADTNSLFNLVDIVDGLQATNIQFVVGLSQDGSVMITTEANSIKAYYCPSSMPSSTIISIPSSIYVNAAMSSTSNSSSNSYSTPTNSSSSNLANGSTNNSTGSTANLLQIITIIFLIVVIAALIIICILINKKLARKTVYSDQVSNNVPSNLTTLNGISQSNNPNTDLIMENKDDESKINLETLDGAKLRNARRKRLKQVEEIHVEEINVDSISMIE